MIPVVWKRTFFRASLRLSIACLGVGLAAWASHLYLLQVQRSEVAQIIENWEGEIARNQLKGERSSVLIEKIEKQLEWKGVKRLRADDLQVCRVVDRFDIKFFGVPSGTWEICFQEGPISSKIIFSWMFFALILVQVLGGLGLYLWQVREQRRNILNSLLRAEKELVEGLARGVAHDLRSPLSALEILAATPGSLDEDPARRRLFENSVSRLHQIAGDVLKSARQERVRSISLGSLHRCFLGVSEELATRFPKHRLRWSLAFDEKFSIFASQGEMERIFQNLVTNSFEADPEACQDVVLEMSTEGDLFRMVVSDRGCGMTEEQLSVLGRAGKTWGKVEGQGFGVSSLMALVERMGGKIRYDSAKGKGTRVTLSIPLHQDQVPVGILSSS